MSDYPYHQRLRLRDFTAFHDLTLEFASGVNVFVGENGTGKTHLMKVLYAFQLAAARHEDIRVILKDLFQTKFMNALVRLGSKTAYAQLDCLYGGAGWSYAIHSEVGSWIQPDSPHSPTPPRPVFIPSIDMMGHTKGFQEAYDEIRLDFDRTCRDIVRLMILERRNGHVLPPLLESLTGILGGDVAHDEEGRFYLVTQEGRLPMPLIAEGLRKIATLLQLQRNGWLAPGTTLFWDEPEVNLNPIVMDEVVGALLALARSGVQIFLATHSYIMLREIEVQSRKTDALRYFALFRSADGVSVHTANSYLDIDPNPIERQYSDLYDRSIAKRIQGATT